MATSPTMGRHHRLEEGASRDSPAPPRGLWNPNALTLASSASWENCVSLSKPRSPHLQSSGFLTSVVRDLKEIGHARRLARGQLSGCPLPFPLPRPLNMPVGKGKNGGRSKANREESTGSPCHLPVTKEMWLTAVLSSRGWQECSFLRPSARGCSLAPFPHGLF